MRVILLASSLFALVSCQEWQWNPWQQRWQWVQSNVRNQQATLAPTTPAPQLSLRDQRLQTIYGIPKKRNANQKLRYCCRKLRNADVECRRKYCDFNALRGDQVVGFMGQCGPKGNTVPEMWDCASSRKDHTDCCRRNGVIDHCLPYCATTDGVPRDYVKYFVCLAQFDKIKNCFQEYLETHPNIKGDF